MMGVLSPSDLVFTEATPQQRMINWRINGGVWAAPLTVDDYVAREAALAETPLSRNGNSRFWVLHRRDNPDDIVSSCETTRKPALVCGGGARMRGGTAGTSDPVVKLDGPDGERTASRVRRVDAYSVACVHTHPRYRARGMAALLLSKIQELFDKQGVECSVLYSDTGRQYYAQMGWEVHPSQQANFYMENGCEAVEKPEGVRFLTKDEIPPLCERDALAVAQRLEMQPEDGLTHFALEPSFAQCSWHFAREEFNAKVLAGRPIERRGAITASGDAWVYWDHDFKRSKLRIQRVVALGPDPVMDVRELVTAALEEAQAWGLQRVMLWNPSDDVTLGLKAAGNKLEGKVKLVFDERWERAIPSLRWRKGMNVGEVVWQENEYYAWC